MLLRSLKLQIKNCVFFQLVKILNIKGLGLPSADCNTIRMRILEFEFENRFEVHFEFFKVIGFLRGSARI